MYLEIIYLIYMYKKDLALNKPQMLICHKTKTNHYLALDRGRIVGFTSFRKVLTLWEMLTASARTWTRDAVFISFVDNASTSSQLALLTEISSKNKSKEKRKEKKNR